MYAKKITLAVIILSFNLTAFATAIPLPKPKSLKLPLPGGVAVQVVTSALLEGIGWVMTEGVKVKKTTDNNQASQADSSSAAVSTPAASADTALPENGDYPYQFIYDGKPFSSAEAAHSYIISSYLTSQGLIRTRNSEGLFYDKLDIYLGSSYYGSDGVGYFISSVQAATAQNPPKNLIGGTLQQFVGTVYYNGKLSESENHLSEDYKNKREKARQAVEQALQNALPDYPPDQADVDQESAPKNPTAPLVTTPTAPTVGNPANDDVYDQPPKKDDDPKKDKKDKPKPPLVLPELDPQTDPNAKPNDKPNQKPKDKPDPNTKPNDKPSDEPNQKPKDKPTKDPITNPDAKPSDKPNVVKPTNPKPQTDAEPNPQQKPDSSKESKPFELPEFCNWASWFCDGTASKEDTEVDIDDDDKIPTDQVNITFGKTCPADKVIPFNLAGHQMKFVMSWYYICDFARLCAPIIKVCSTILALFILAGIRS